MRRGNPTPPVLRIRQVGLDPQTGGTVTLAHAWIAPQASGMVHPMTLDVASPWKMAIPNPTIIEHRDRYDASDRAR
jgi:hypothetical protein